MRDFRFTRSYRLVRPEEFQRVFQDPCKSADKFLVVLARKNHCGLARLGLAISLKATGIAVTRNRIKRVIRESFRQQRAALAGLDFVVTARGGIGKGSNKELRASLEKHWSVLVECKKS